MSDGTFTLSQNVIGNGHIQTGAGIVATKLQQRHIAGTSFDLAIGDTPAAREEIVHVVRNDGTIREFIGLLDATGSATTDIDFILKVNGSSVLSANANVLDTDSDREVKNGTISSASVSAGDVLSIELVINTGPGSGAAGPWAQATIDELPKS